MGRIRTKKGRGGWKKINGKGRQKIRWGKKELKREKKGWKNYNDKNNRETMSQKEIVRIRVTVK